jgi:hypothetical protein
VLKIQCGNLGEFLGAVPFHKQVYTPDQMKVLQQAFESIWDELEDAGRVQATDENMRQYVSGLVMSHAAPDYLNVEAIRELVRRSLKLAS